MEMQPTCTYVARFQTRFGRTRGDLTRDISSLRVILCYVDIRKVHSDDKYGTYVKPLDIETWRVKEHFPSFASGLARYEKIIFDIQRGAVNFHLTLFRYF